MLRWYWDWRTQAVLCVLFIGFAAYFVLVLLDGGEGLSWIQVALFAFLAASAGHRAVTERRAKLREQHKDDSSD